MSATATTLPTEQSGTRKNYYARHTSGLRRELADALPTQPLKRIHRIQPWRHLATGGSLLLLLLMNGWSLIRFQDVRVIVPLMLLQGLILFNFTVLLHEVVHGIALGEHARRANLVLGYLYATLSGLSMTQFTRWHLDHHDSLGSATEDPKRHHLSPRINRRWIKLLYFTPALFVIYFRAARKEAASYPAVLQRRIAAERRVAIAFHLLGLAALVFWAGWGAAARAYLVPYLAVFPAAFALNRLGQHYNVDPSDPARWSTLMRGNALWNLAYLWSNYHLEHHYFPKVPMYNLRQLHALLQPFYRSKNMHAHGYLDLAVDYLIRNRAPHSNWSLPLD